MLALTKRTHGNPALFEYMYFKYLLNPIYSTLAIRPHFTSLQPYDLTAPFRMQYEITPTDSSLFARSSHISERQSFSTNHHRRFPRSLPCSRTGCLLVPHRILPGYLWISPAPFIIASQPSTMNPDYPINRHEERSMKSEVESESSSQVERQIEIAESRYILPSRRSKVAVGTAESYATGP